MSLSDGSVSDVKHMYGVSGRNCIWCGAYVRGCQIGRVCGVDHMYKAVR
jgi:hypothetical protein